MTVRVDVTGNRATRVWTWQTNIARVLWAIAQPFFRFSPRPFWGWRRWMLRRFGAQIGTQAHIYPTVRIAFPWHLMVGDQAALGDHVIIYALGRIEVGARATVSQYAHLCAGTHVWRDAARPLVKVPIAIGADAWICADAFVGPGVHIGRGAILGARAVAMKDLAAGHIGFGNPMQVRKP